MNSETLSFALGIFAGNWLFFPLVLKYLLKFERWTFSRGFCVGILAATIYVSLKAFIPS